MTNNDDVRRALLDRADKWLDSARLVQRETEAVTLVRALSDRLREEAARRAEPVGLYDWTSLYAPTKKETT